MVKETEKKLIENNLIDQKHLTADRSFVLFDPEPLLNDTDQYTKYSPQELIDIIKNYDSDFEKYEATKSTSQKCLVPKDTIKEVSNINQVNLENSSLIQPTGIDKELKYTHTDKKLQCQYSSQNYCEEKQNTIEINSKENISLNKTNDVIENKIDTKTTQRPRFTNVYDLFQIPDFSLLKPVQNDNAHSSNGNSVVKEDSDESTHEKNSIQEEYEDEEELFSDNSEDFNLEEESSNVDEEEEISDVEEELSYFEEEEENESFDEDIESKSSHYSHDNHERFSVKSTDRSLHKYVCNNQQDYATSQKTTNANNDEHLVDYDILNDWYQMWKQQMNFIQTCVKMSK